MNKATDLVEVTQEDERAAADLVLRLSAAGPDAMATIVPMAFARYRHRLAQPRPETARELLAAEYDERFPVTAEAIRQGQMQIGQLGSKIAPALRAIERGPSPRPEPASTEPVELRPDHPLYLRPSKEAIAKIEAAETARKVGAHRAKDMLVGSTSPAHPSEEVRAMVERITAFLVEADSLLRSAAQSHDLYRTEPSAFERLLEAMRGPVGEAAALLERSLQAPGAVEQRLRTAIEAALGQLNEPGHLARRTGSNAIAMGLREALHPGTYPHLSQAGLDPGEGGTC